VAAGAWPLALPETDWVLELLLESDVPVPLTAFVLCACRLAIKLCMNCCIAVATSWLLEPEELALVADVPEVALALLVPVVLAPVTPICERASNMELISPPPRGGGCDTAELTSDVLVVSD
jgi:hypothetical protein